MFFTFGLILIGFPTFGKEICLLCAYSNYISEDITIKVIRNSAKS